MESRLDIVIFGATGFTGKEAVRQMVSIWRSQRGSEGAWGVAGRSLDKLKKLIEDIQNDTGEDLKDVKIIVASIENEDSLKDMTAQTKVVVNCCGPYRFYGEPVVKACIATNTHHVDVSGEPQFMETMQLKYHRAAKEAGVYIVSACGFDSIPNDLGVIFLQKNFKGTVNSIESYLHSKAPPSNGGAVIHYGTWESLIHGITHMDELPHIRKQIYPNKLPQMLPKLHKRGALFRGYNGKDWCIPFPGSDNSVVYRSQRYVHEELGRRPGQFQAYFNVKSLLAAVFLLMGAAWIFLLSKFDFTRSLMLKYPKIFSFGAVSHEGPSKEQMNNTLFWFYIIGQGWDESVSDITKESPRKEVRVKVTGVNPGYGATVVALLLSAFTILKEPHNLPPQGGVYTPGAAFGNTSLIESLHANNLKFEVIEE